jgi:hypothetical protein
VAEFVYAAVFNAASAVGATTLTASAIAGFASTYGLVAGGLALSASQAKKAKRKARDAYNAQQVDRLVNTSSAVADRELVLGRVRKGGAVFFKASTGTHKTTFVQCIALAAHEVDALEQIWFNDTPVTVDGSGNVQTMPWALSTTTSGWAVGTGSAQDLPHVPIAGSVRAHTGTAGGPEGDLLEVAVTGSAADGTGTTLTTELGANISYQYMATTSYANVRLIQGTDTQAADAELMGLFPGQWTSEHRARGVCYLICRFSYHETAFHTGLPLVTATIRGAKVYDPRTTLTAWSDNPALLMRHVYTHARFGKATASAAEDLRIGAAADACDTSTNWVVDGITTTAPLYRAGLVAPFGTPARDALDDLAQAMAGSWAFAGGSLYLKPGTWAASVKTLTEADLAVVTRASGGGEQMQAIDLVVHRERTGKFNTVNVQLYDQAQSHKRVALTPVTDAALVTRDGATLAQGVDMPAVSYAPQAQHVAAIMMRDARDPLTVTLPFKLSAYPLELFDTVALTIARYGWSAKLFQITARSWSADGRLLLTLKETAESIFTLGASFAAQGGAANTLLPAPWYVAPPGQLTISSGTAELVTLGDGTVASRMRVSWPAIADAAVLGDGGRVEVQYRSVLSDGPWSSATVDGTATQVVIADVQDGNVYTVRARARSARAVSDWCAQLVHSVQGKTAPPTSISTFTIDGDRLAWGTVSDADLAGYEIRFQYGLNTWWDSAAPLHDGLLTASPYTLTRSLQGAVTFLIKAVDTSGNRSATAATITSDMGTSVLANLYLSWPQDPTFTEGTILGGSVVGAQLVADAADLFYGADAEPFYGPDTDVFYLAGTYGAMSYTWSIAPSAAGTLVLEHTVAADSFVIEYQRDSAAAFYGPDADDFYGPSADGFYGSPSAWASWPGTIELSASESINFRISTAAGATQGIISIATPKLDVPDVIENFADVVTVAAGRRLPITKTFRSIERVLLTVQTDGNGGITATVEDKNATLGPLVIVRDAAGTAVDGLVDAIVQGY